MEQKISIAEAVQKRQSVRSYAEDKLSEQELRQIIDYADSIAPLTPNVKVKAEIVGADDVKSIMKWRAPHYLAIYATESDEGLMSAGYVYEQVVLYLTSLGIGTCWATSVSPKEKHESSEMKWAAVVAFGKPENGNGWRDSANIKRRSMEEISDKPDESLMPARIAPSAMNNQPWYFRHEGDGIQVYCKKQGFMKKWMVSQNRIDIGIALGNLKAVNSEMAFIPAKKSIEKDGYTLMGMLRFS